MTADFRLSVLDRVAIASPCPARWEDMRGDDKVRHCDLCNLKVHDFSAMSRAEAESIAARLLDPASGRVCARFYRRADGRILTRDCPVGLAAAKAQLARLARGIAALIGLVTTGGLLAGAQLSGQRSARLASMQPFAAIRAWLAPAVAPPPPGGLVLMGDVCVTPPPAGPPVAPSPAR